MAIQQELIAAEDHEESLWPGSDNDSDDDKESVVEGDRVRVPFRSLLRVCSKVLRIMLENIIILMFRVSITPTLGTALRMVSGLGLRINRKRTIRIQYQLTWPTGITVIDISDLGHVRYCFIITPVTHGPPGREGVYRLTPLSAWDYLKAYDDIKSEETEAYASFLRPFKGVDLVTTDALQETWPDAKWFYNSSQIQSTGTVSTSLEGTVTKALRDVALDSFLAYLLDPSQDDPSLLAQAESLPDFSLQLKRKLLAEAQSLQPSRFVLHCYSKPFREKPKWI